jgi:hypothetical protein
LLTSAPLFLAGGILFALARKPTLAQPAASPVPADLPSQTRVS